MSLDLGSLEFYAPYVAGIALHGIVDILIPLRILCYAPALLPLQGPLMKAAFFGASVVHLSYDVHPFVSVALHALIALFTFFGALNAATVLMIFYLCAVHIPLLVVKALYWKLYLSAFSILASVIIGAWQGLSLLYQLKLLEHDKDGKAIRLVLPPLAQRIVVCHVVANLLLY
jgi:hypothetical protein